MNNEPAQGGTRRGGAVCRPFPQAGATPQHACAETAQSSCRMEETANTAVGVAFMVQVVEEGGHAGIAVPILSALGRCPGASARLGPRRTGDNREWGIWPRVARSSRS